MKTIFILYISSLLFFSYQQSKLVKTKIGNGITMMLPEDFMPMSPEDLRKKYLSDKPPYAAFTDYSRAIDLGINLAISQWNEEDLEIMKGFYKSNIMGLYDEVQFINESIQNINGRDFAVFEFISTVLPDEEAVVQQGAIKKYIWIQYTIVKGKTVLFNFSCPASQKEKWMPIAKEFLKTVKISKTL